MALTGFDQYAERLAENRVADFQMSTAFGVALRLCFGSRVFVPTPAVPTASVALDKDSAHSLGPIPGTDGGRLTMLAARMNPSSIGGQAVILADLLNISGGLNGTLATEQTDNLPTAALTRHTSGAGVMAGLVIFAAVGSTARTVTASYTNQAGTPGRVTPPFQIGATGHREAGRLIPFPLAAGDTGVRSVESVTLADTTGTAGNFGVCLFRPLSMLACNDFQGAHVFDAVSTGGFVGSLAEVHPDACLSVLGIANVSQAVSGSIILAEV